MKPILTIPDFMPLSAEQRAWLQGYYAGMAMQAEMSVSTGSGVSSFAVDILIGTRLVTRKGWPKRWPCRWAVLVRRPGCINSTMSKWMPWPRWKTS